MLVIKSFINTLDKIVYSLDFRLFYWINRLLKKIIIHITAITKLKLLPYMLLRTEESLFLPPLIPAELHIFWAVGLWEGQSSV